MILWTLNPKVMAVLLGLACVMVIVIEGTSLFFRLLDWWRDRK